MWRTSTKVVPREPYLVLGSLRVIAGAEDEWALFFIDESIYIRAREEEVSNGNC